MLSTGPRNEVRFISCAIRCFGYLRAEIFGQCKLIFSAFNLLFPDSCGLGQDTCSGQQVYSRALGEKGRQGQGLCPGLGSSAVNGLTVLPSSPATLWADWKRLRSGLEHHLFVRVKI